MIQLSPQGTKQRVGKLIENHVCNKYGLEFNKRQQTRGYFDAYDADNIFEIKAVKNIKNQNTRLTIFFKNHKALLTAGNGKYVIVKYELINKDKDLQLIQDIKILQETIMTSEKMNGLLIQRGVPYTRNFRGHIKEYVRVKHCYIEGMR